MSDPEVPQNDKPSDIDDVVGSANEGLDAAAAARADVPGSSSAADAVDPDLAAFEAAERDHPDVFAGSEQSAAQGPSADDASADDASATAAADIAAPATAAADEVAPSTSESDHSEPVSSGTVSDDAGYDLSYIEAAGDDTVVQDATPSVADDATLTHETAPSVADTAYAASAASTAETQVMPAEPMAPPAAPQPIFVQAPEPPRDLGNRGAAGGIGVVAALAFAILYLGAILGLGALAGDVTAENIGTSALAPLTTWSFWVPVAVFFLAFWLLGAFVNRARWGKWVILGLLVAVATYGGHVLGQLFQAPFWRINGSESAALVDEQLLAPLAIAAFVIARELTIWFGAWVARAGARKKVLNAEAQAEYERTLEAGPSAQR